MKTNRERANMIFAILMLVILLLGNFHLIFIIY